MSDTDVTSTSGIERVNLSSDTLDLLDQYRSDDGGRETYEEVIQQLLRGDVSPCERLGCPNPAVDLDVEPGTSNTRRVCESHALDTETPQDGSRDE